MSSAAELDSIGMASALDVDCKLSTCAFWEAECFTTEETAAALALLRSVEESCGHREAFTMVERDASSEWLYQKMMDIARQADQESGWNLLPDRADAVDTLIYDRFGPSFTDVEFKWHCDAMDTDPRRRISVVTYFTPPDEYEGGLLQMKICPEELVHKRYSPGWAVAFPSQGLEHCVTPVTSGERRSLLLIVGLREDSTKFTRSMAYAPIVNR